jgi:hypothetical protein
MHAFDSIVTAEMAAPETFWVNQTSDKPNHNHAQISYSEGWQESTETPFQTQNCPFYWSET